MAKGTGTGFFMPRSFEDVAPQLTTQSTGLDTATRDPHSALRSDSKRHRHNNRRFASAKSASTGSLSSTNSGATSRAGSSQGAVHVGGTTASAEHTATSKTVASRSLSSSSVAPAASPPATCKPNIQLAPTGAVPLTSTASSGRGNWQYASCLSPAAPSLPSSMQLSAGSNLQLTGSFEPPGSAVNSWDTLELLGLSPGTAPSIRIPSSTSRCLTPFVSSAAAGSGPCDTAAAPGGLPLDWTNSPLLSGLDLQAAVPAQDEVSSADAIIPFCGSSSLQTSVAPRDPQQAVLHSGISAADTLLQLRAKLSAAKAAAGAQADVHSAPCCTSLGGSLLGPGGVDVASGSVFDVPSLALDLLGGCNSGTTACSSSALALPTMMSSNNSVPNGLPLTSLELGSSGSLFAGSSTLASAGQHVVGNEVALAAAMAAQEKLAQLAQLDTMYEQLRQDFMHLLPLI